MLPFSKLKHYYIWKMYGYPNFSFWTSKSLAEFCFLRIVLARKNIRVLVGTTHRKPEDLEMRRTYAQ